MRTVCENDSSFRVPNILSLAGPVKHPSERESSDKLLTDSDDGLCQDRPCVCVFVWSVIQEVQPLYSL